MKKTMKVLNQESAAKVVESKIDGETLDIQKDEEAAANLPILAGMRSH